MIVIDSEWKQNANKSFNFGVLVWEAQSDEPHFLQLLPDEPISWTILGPKRCIGSRNNSGKMLKCPELTTLGKNKQRCGPCSAIDIYDPCIRCTGKSCNANEERAEKCAKTEYAVYLTLFSDKTLKVGVSVERRIITRWVEQGADYGMILVKVRGGMIARNIENILSKDTILRKSVHPSRKSSVISESLKDDEAIKHVSAFKESLDFSLYDFDFDFGRLTNLSKHYNLSEIQATPSEWLDSHSRIDGNQLFGQVVGMKGTHLVTRINNAYTVANLRRMVGYTIDSEREIKAVTQSGLLDFF